MDLKEHFREMQRAFLFQTTQTSNMKCLNINVNNRDSINKLLTLSGLLTLILRRFIFEVIITESNTIYFKLVLRPNNC